MHPFYEFFGWICIIALLAGMQISSARAQQTEAPFETMTLRAGPTANVNHERLHDFWQPGYGALLEAEMPFYAGRVEAGLAWHRYEPRAESMPRFDALFTYLGWRLRWQPARWLRLSAGPRLGNYLMRFDSDRLPGLKRESELMVALNLRLVVRVTGHWHAFTTGSYQKLFTARRIRLGYVAVGVSRDLSTPDWLKSFLE